MVATPKHEEDVPHLTFEIALQTNPHLIRHKKLAWSELHLISRLESPSIHEAALGAETLSILPEK